jgi:hypothetical protein
MSISELFEPVLLMFPPLAVAAGVDLYLTLLFLGAAPYLGWWETLPGALADLSSPGVLLTVGTFYALELAAERWPPTALIWNAFHAIIRPLAGVLLGLLLLDGQPVDVAVIGALLSGIIASAAHATRTGGGVLLWFDERRHPSRILISLAEDVSVVGLVVLLLDRPLWAFLGALLAGVPALRFMGSQVRAFLFAVRLVGSAAWTIFTRPRWTEPQAFPGWVRAALEGDVMAPGGGLRGSRAGGHRLPDSPRFTAGWVVVRGDTPLFVYRRFGASHSVGLGSMTATRVSGSTFFRRVELNGGQSGTLYFALGGPGTESLEAEFVSG